MEPSSASPALGKAKSAHRLAVLQALFVTLLWSTSFVLIKIGLGSIPALTFAGLRYALAFLCLLPFAVRQIPWRTLTLADWLRLTGLGLLYYAVTQGAQFIGLGLLPAVTVSLLFSFTSLFVGLLGAWLIDEHPTRLQWVGTGLFLAGTLVYFYPAVLPRGQWLGILVMVIGTLSNSLSAVWGRSINREERLPPLAVTTVSMGAGALFLLVGGLATQGLPVLSLKDWGLVAWLAVVSTAFAFTLWNQTLRTLSAMESSTINNTMLIQIAILAWAFLGERLSGQAVLGLALAAAGAVLVQRRSTTSKGKQT